MESNKDEALKCLSIAQKHLNARNLPSARRFCQKSLNLFSTPEGAKLLDIIESEIDSSASSSSASSAASRMFFTASKTSEETVERSVPANGSTNTAFASASALPATPSEIWKSAYLKKEETFSVSYFPQVVLNITYASSLKLAAV